jgi:hypothetical protein
VSSNQVSKTIKIKIYKTVIFLFICRSVKLCQVRGKHRLNLYEKWMLRVLGAERDEVTEAGRNHMRRSSKCLLFINHCQDDEIKEDEVGEACKRDEKCVQHFCWSLKGRDHLEDQGIDERIMLKGFQGKKIRACGLDRLAQDRDEQQALENSVMNLWVP